MRGILAGIIGGALAGMGMTAVVIAEKRLPRRDTGGRDSVPTTLESPQTDTNRTGTIGHFVASAGFGATYALLRRWVPGLPSAGIGTAYGAGVYAIDLAGAAPRDGETKRSAKQMAGRLTLQLLFGAGTALAMAMLTDRDPESA